MKKLSKIIICLVLSCSLAFGLVACGGVETGATITSTEFSTLFESSMTALQTKATSLLNADKLGVTATLEATNKLTQGDKTDDANITANLKATLLKTDMSKSVVLFSGRLPIQFSQSEKPIDIMAYWKDSVAYVKNGDAKRKMSLTISDILTLLQSGGSLQNGATPFVQMAATEESSLVGIIKVAAAQAGLELSDESITYILSLIGDFNPLDTLFTFTKTGKQGNEVLTAAATTSNVKATITSICNTVKEKIETLVKDLKDKKVGAIDILKAYIKSTSNTPLTNDQLNTAVDNTLATLTDKTIAELVKTIEGQKTAILDGIVTANFAIIYSIKDSMFSALSANYDISLLKEVAGKKEQVAINTPSKVAKETISNTIKGELKLNLTLSETLVITPPTDLDTYVAAA